MRDPEPNVRSMHVHDLNRELTAMMVCKLKLYGVDNPAVGYVNYTKAMSHTGRYGVSPSFVGLNQISLTVCLSF